MVTSFELIICSDSYLLIHIKEEDKTKAKLKERHFIFYAFISQETNSAQVGVCLAIQTQISNKLSYVKQAFYCQLFTYV